MHRCSLPISGDAAIGLGAVSRPTGNQEPHRMTPDGLVTCSSDFSAKETMDRLAAAVSRHGMSVFARIDHAAGAADVDMKLRPTELLIFGSPRGGTPLMQLNQLMGIDLPLKALVWDDEAGNTWVGYNDPHWLAARHEIASMDHLIDAMASALATIAHEATTQL
jgi:uncharacterized protein (DUF302 family)